MPSQRIHFLVKNRQKPCHCWLLAKRQYRRSAYAIPSQRVGDAVAAPMPEPQKTAKTSAIAGFWQSGDAVAAGTPHRFNKQPIPSERLRRTVAAPMLNLKKPPKAM
jgi:hypothetical protein